MKQVTKNYLFAQINSDLKWEKFPLPTNLNSKPDSSSVIVIDSNGQLQEQELSLVNQYLIRNCTNNSPKWMDIENCYLTQLSHIEIGAGIKLHINSQFFEFYGNIEKWLISLKKLTIQLNFQHCFKLIRKLIKIDSEEFFMARNKYDGREYAVKILEKDNLMESTRDVKFLIKELQILRQLSNELIIKFNECFEGEKQILIIFEQFYGQTLLDYKQKKLIQSEEQVSKIIHKILKILNHFHHKGFVINNLSMNSFVFRQRDNIDTLSFIFCRNSQVVYADDLEKMHQFYIGQQKSVIDYKVDIKELGTIMIELCNFNSNIPSGDESFTKEQQINNLPLSFEGKLFLSQLLDENQKNRPSAFDALSHPWFLKGLIPKKNQVLERMKKSNIKLASIESHLAESEKSSSPLSPYYSARDNDSPLSNNSIKSFNNDPSSPNYLTNKTRSPKKSLQPLRGGSVDKTRIHRLVKESTFKPMKQTNQDYQLKE